MLRIVKWTILSLVAIFGVMISAGILYELWKSHSAKTFASQQSVDLIWRESEKRRDYGTYADITDLFSKGQSQNEFLRNLTELGFQCGLAAHSDPLTHDCQGIIYWEFGCIETLHVFASFDVSSQLASSSSRIDYACW